MWRNYTFEAVDLKFRDFMGSVDTDLEKVIFGGKVFLLTRQVVI
jgi:hypothetical protein